MAVPGVKITLLLGFVAIATIRSDAQMRQIARFSEDRRTAGVSPQLGIARHKNFNLLRSKTPGYVSNASRGQVKSRVNHRVSVFPVLQSRPSYRTIPRVVRISRKQILQPHISAQAAQSILKQKGQNWRQKIVQQQQLSLQHKRQHPQLQQLNLQQHQQQLQNTASRMGIAGSLKNQARRTFVDGENYQRTTPEVDIRREVQPPNQLYVAQMLKQQRMEQESTAEVLRRKEIERELDDLLQVQRFRAAEFRHQQILLQQQQHLLENQEQLLWYKRQIQQQEFHQQQASVSKKEKKLNETIHEEKPEKQNLENNKNPILTKRERVLRLAELLGLQPFDLLNVVVELEASQNMIDKAPKRHESGSNDEKKKNITNDTTATHMKDVVLVRNADITVDPKADDFFNRTIVEIPINDKQPGSPTEISQKMFPTDVGQTTSPTDLGRTISPLNIGQGSSPAYIGQTKGPNVVTRSDDAAADTVWVPTEDADSFTAAVLRQITFNESTLNDVVLRLAIDLLTNKINHPKLEAFSSSFDSAPRQEVTTLLADNTTQSPPIPHQSTTKSNILTTTSIVYQQNFTRTLPATNDERHVLTSTHGGSGKEADSTLISHSISGDLKQTHRTYQSDIKSDVDFQKPKYDSPNDDQAIIQALITQRAQNSLPREDHLAQVSQSLLNQVQGLLNPMIVITDSELKDKVITHNSSLSHNLLPPSSTTSKDSANRTDIRTSPTIFPTSSNAVNDGQFTILRTTFNDTNDRPNVVTSPRQFAGFNTVDDGQSTIVRKTLKDSDDATDFRIMSYNGKTFTSSNNKVEDVGKSNLLRTIIIKAKNTEDNDASYFGSTLYASPIDTLRTINSNYNRTTLKVSNSTADIKTLSNRGTNSTTLNESEDIRIGYYPGPISRKSDNIYTSPSRDAKDTTTNDTVQSKTPHYLSTNSTTPKSEIDARTVSNISTTSTTPKGKPNTGNASNIGTTPITPKDSINTVTVSNIGTTSTTPDGKIDTRTVSNIATTSTTPKVKLYVGNVTNFGTTSTTPKVKLYIGNITNFGTTSTNLKDHTYTETLSTIGTVSATPKDKIDTRNISNIGTTPTTPKDTLSTGTVPSIGTTVTTKIEMEDFKTLSYMGKTFRVKNDFSEIEVATYSGQNTNGSGNPQDNNNEGNLNAISSDATFQPIKVSNSDSESSLSGKLSRRLGDTPEATPIPFNSDQIGSGPDQFISDGSNTMNIQQTGSHTPVTVHSQTDPQSELSGNDESLQMATAIAKMYGISFQEAMILLSIPNPQISDTNSKSNPTPSTTMPSTQIMNQKFQNTVNQQIVQYNYPNNPSTLQTSSQAPQSNAYPSAINQNYTLPLISLPSPQLVPPLSLTKNNSNSESTNQNNQTTDGTSLTNQADKQTNKINSTNQDVPQKDRMDPINQEAPQKDKTYPTNQNAQSVDSTTPISSPRSKITIMDKPDAVVVWKSAITQSATTTNELNHVFQNVANQTSASDNHLENPIYYAGYPDSNINFPSTQLQIHTNNSSSPIEDNVQTLLSTTKESKHQSTFLLKYFSQIANGITNHREQKGNSLVKPTN